MIDSGVWLFVTTYFLSVVTGGPGIAALVSRTIAYGWRGTPWFSLGFVVADLIFLTAAIYGGAALADRGAPVLLVIKYAGAGFLMYLAYRMWTLVPRVGVTSAPEGRSDSSLFFASFFLTLGNPKPIMFFAAVVPAVVDLERVTPVDILAMMASVPVVIGTVNAAYVFLATRVRGLFRTSESMRVLNRCGAIVMVAAALLVTIR
jgi:threonine/homoserine/homoserine lactone efflux protein